MCIVFWLKELLVPIIPPNKINGNSFRSFSPVAVELPGSDLFNLHHVKSYEL